MVGAGAVVGAGTAVAAGLGASVGLGAAVGVAAGAQAAKAALLPTTEAKLIKRRRVKFCDTVLLLIIKRHC